MMHQWITRTEMNKTINRCDIFCNVIDNYGDIGVSWRLARQLATEHGLAVRLWVDDLGSLAKLCPEADTMLSSQFCRGVEVCLWGKEFPDVLPADVVIEAFSCRLPEPYITAMAAQAPQPAWINLEYLSAEDWVHSCHKLPSPHPSLPLTKYFFFPGFTKQTGGLLLEHDLLTRRDAFQSDVLQQQAFWRSMGMEMPLAETLKISLFAYENAALPSLLDVWSASAQPVLCLIPVGRILPQVGQFFGDEIPHAGSEYARGNLQVRVLPFLEQERYDQLLWACDMNFVRGEDSCVRAQWARRPFVWQIYPQHDAVHLKKLQAFLTLYKEQLGQPAGQAVEGLWQAWNGDEAWQAIAEITSHSTKPSNDKGQVAGYATDIGQAWTSFVAARGELDSHAQHWAWQLAENNLALNLLDFCREIGRMRALEIEGSKHEDSTRSSRR